MAKPMIVGKKMEFYKIKRTFVGTDCNANDLKAEFALVHLF